MTDNFQVGPPGCGDMIEDVVNHITYKPGIKIRLENGWRPYEHLAGGSGLTLVIEIDHITDSTDPSRTVGLTHYFVVPPATYDRETWERWVLDRLVEFETHECMEHFKVDGWAPFFPPHGDQNGQNPYTIARRQRVS